MLSTRRITMLLTAILLLVAFITGCSTETQTTAGNSIKLIGVDGQSVEVSLDEFAADVITGKGSFKKSTGTIEGPWEFKGIAIDTLLEKVGGLPEGSGIEVLARDGYGLTYTYSQITGNIITYDANGAMLNVGGVTAMLALECDGNKDYEGSPRLVFVNEAGAITDGHYWTREIAEIKLLESADDWVVKLHGYNESQIDRATFESLATCPDSPHPAEALAIEDKDGSTKEYEGVPLWLLVSMVDGGDAPDGHYQFNDKVASQYKVQITSRDGYSVELDGAEVARNGKIMLGYKLNGNVLPEDEFPLALVGPSLTKKQMVKQVADINLINLPANQ